MAKITYPYETPPEFGEAIEVADGVLWLRQPLPMALDHVNIFAFDEGDGWAIVDTGFDTKESRDMWQEMFKGPLGGKPVTRVLGTHHHPDHIGLAGWFQSDFGAELITTRTAWLFARMLTLDVHDTLAPEAEQHYRRAGMSDEILQTRKAERPFNFADCVAPMPLGFTRIKDGDVVTFGGRSWDVRCGNGHAPEHATLWSRDDNLVIGGDQLLPHISANIGVYATEPEADPLSEWLESCERLAQYATEDQLVLPGHKLPFTGLPHRLKLMAENHEHALERLLEHVTEPKVGGECFSPLFKRKIGPAEYGLALVEALAHLNCLYQKGLVTRTLNAKGAYEWCKVRT